MGCLPDRKQTIEDLLNLPRVHAATFWETLTMMEENQLYGKGLQWNDLVILASVLINPGTLLWTRDRRLADAAGEMAVHYAPDPVPDDL